MSSGWERARAEPDAVAQELARVLRDARELADSIWMEVALREAERAALHHDVPVGAVVVDEAGQLLGHGRNRRELDQDPLAHAELLALQAAARVKRRWRLDGATLYTTLEPCPMCAGAMINSRLSRVVFAALDPKAGALASLYQLGGDRRLNHRLEVAGGVLADPSQRLLQAFFRRLRASGKK